MVSETAQAEETQPEPDASRDAREAPTGAGCRPPRAWVRRHRPGLVLPRIPSGVALGLLATTAGITLISYLTAPSGQGSNLANTLGLVLPTLGAVGLYAALARAHPRCRHQAAPHLLALLALAGGAYAAKMLPLPGNAIVAIVLYGAVVHARLVCGRVRARVVAGALALGLLPLGPTALTPSAYGLWLVGLLYVYAVTDQGVAERAARRHSEHLVQELQEAQAQLRAYAAQAEEVATTRERTRLARELHDTLAQGLAAITLHLDVGDTVFDTSPAQARQALRQARAIAQTHLREARRTVLALRLPAAAQPLGSLPRPLPLPLPAALAALAAAWDPGPGAPSGQATFQADAGVAAAGVAPAVELAMYRVAQEALRNAACHGHARQVAVELSLEPQGFCLTVTDDGCGFDPAAVRPNADGGVGLIGMRERVELLGGRLEVISAPGAGTQIVATVPMAAPGTAVGAEEG